MRIETSSGHTILADDSDYQLLFQYTWHAKKATGGRFYAWTNKPGDYTPVRRHMSMHRLLMNPPADMVVHHINNNGLDNRRSNLEITTVRGNNIYARQGKGASVYLRENGKWTARVRRPDDKRLVNLGTHTTREAAIAIVRAYKLEIGI